MIHYTTWEQVKDLFITLVKAGFMAGFMLLFVLEMAEYSLYLQLLISGIFGLVFYVLLNWMLKSPQLTFVFELIKNQKN